MNPALAVPAFGPALPEIILAVGALVLVLIGAFRGERSSGVRERGGARAPRPSPSSRCLMLPASPTQTLGGSFVIDAFAKFMKVLTLIGAAAASSCRPTICGVRGSAASSFRS